MSRFKKILIVALLVEVCAIMLIVPYYNKKKLDSEIAFISATQSVSTTLAATAEPLSLPAGEKPAQTQQSLPAPTSEPTSRNITIDQKVDNKVSIFASACEPASLDIVLRKDMSYVSFSQRETLQKLLVNQDSSRSSEKIRGEENRTDIHNDAGEYVLLEDGRLEYYRSKEACRQLEELMGYLTTMKSETKWLYPYKDKLSQELSFGESKYATEMAVNLVKSIQSDNFPYDVTVEGVYAATYSQLKEYHKMIKKGFYYNYSGTPGEADLDFGGDGLYRIDLRFTLNDAPIFSRTYDTDSGSHTGTRIRSISYMEARAIVSQQGVIALTMSYLRVPSGEKAERILSIEAAVQAFADDYKDIISSDKISIDRIYMMYAPLRMNDGEFSKKYFLLPIWCFADDNPQGYAKGVTLQYYVNALTGEMLNNM